MFFGRILRGYNAAMERRPYLVTSLTTGVCYASGDLLAQYIEMKQGKRTTYDTLRTCVFGVFGTVFAGPIYCAWFRKIDKMPSLIDRVVRWNQKRLITRNAFKDVTLGDKPVTIRLEAIEKPIIRSKTVLVCKVYADQFIFSVLYPIFFMVASGVMLDMARDTWPPSDDEKKETITLLQSFTKAVDNVKNKFVKIYVMDCALWPLVQMANFAFIPTAYQAVFVNAINVGWNAFLSYVSQDKDSGH